MATRRFWQTGWFPGLVISLFFLSLGWTGFIASLEWRAFGLGTQLSPAIDAGDNLEIIAIDEASLQELGEWPWPRSYLGVVIKQLNQQNARTIGLALPLHTAQSEFGVKRLDSMRDTYDGKYEKTVKDILFLARQRLDTDGALAASLRRSDNTVLGISYGLNNEIPGSAKSGGQQIPESYALADLPTRSNRWSDYIPGVLSAGIPELTQAQAPLPLLAKHSSAGMLDESVSGDSDSLVKPLVLKFGDQYYPSFSLMFAAESLNVNTKDIVIEPDQGSQSSRFSPGPGHHARRYQAAHGPCLPALSATVQKPG